MIAYTSIDIIASVMKNTIFIVNFMTKDNYVEHYWCVAYEQKRIDNSESVLQIVNDIVQAILPGMLMTGLAIGTIYIIRRQIKACRRLQ